MSTAELLALLQPDVDGLFDVALQPSTEGFEHGRSPGKHDVVVQGPPHVDWAILYDVVNDFAQGRCEVRV